LSNLVLETDRLTKSFATADGWLEVLKGIDMKVREGEFVSIIGPSGVGKSTLLHLLGGLDPASSGEISINGQNLALLSEAELDAYRNKAIGFVFQFHYLLEEFTALENTMMPLLVRGWGRNNSQSAAVEALEAVGLGQRISHRPAQLSGGERQRVAVARAVVGSPRILIADEPTGDLDSETALELRRLFKSLNEGRNMTLVVATHDGALAELAETRYRLRDGQLHLRGLN
jgi:lipoprotein-releasing system ATP-binding protein